MKKILRNFGKKKKLCLFFLIIEALLITNCIIGIVNAFGNGKYLTGTFDAYSPSFVSDWWAGEHYGTHDWVAQAALEAVKANPAAGLKWMKNDVSFWDKRRETIFLIGTEAPDANSLQLRGTLNGDSVKGLHDVIYHHMYFHDTDTLPIELRMKPRVYTFDISRKVIRATKMVKNFLREGRCDLAAFYLGTIAHYITDVANFLTVLQENVEVSTVITDEKKLLHGKFETHIEAAMRDHERRKRYFDYDITFNVESRNPWECVKTVAFDTRWDLQRDNIDFVDTSTLNPGSQDAVWFYTSFRSWMNSLEPYS